MMKIVATILVDTDSESDVFDGLNEGFRSLQGEHDWIVDWAYSGEPVNVPIVRNVYEEGQAFQE